MQAYGDMGGQMQMQRRRKPLAMLGGLALAGAPAAPMPMPGPAPMPPGVVNAAPMEGAPAMPPAGGMPPGMPPVAPPGAPMEGAPDALTKGLPGSTTEPYRNPGSLVGLGGGGMPPMRRGMPPAVGMRKPMARLGLAMSQKKRRGMPQRLGGPAY